MKRLILLVLAVAPALAWASANLQQNLRFALRNPQAVRLRALARAAARMLAAALGLRIARIASARETGAAAPLRRARESTSQAVRLQSRATPIERSAIHVTAGVGLTVVAAPR